MNKLEKMGLDELEKQLSSALDRLNDDNAHRIEHERIFIKGDVKRAFEVVRALQENASK